MADPSGPAQRALVTGAAGGIGHAIAARLLAAGWTVAAADLDRARLDLAARGWDRSPFVAVELDVRRRESVDLALERTWDQLGGQDLLVNCAGIYPSHPILEMEDADWDRVLATNLRGPFLLSRAFARRLVEAGYPGQIVNVTSGAARRARRGAAHYCTSKAALEMLTRCLAIELAEHGIRVNAVAPGFVEVGSATNPLSEDYRRAITAAIPLGRAGRPEDIAEMVLFLTGPAAEWVTGASFSIDGGSGAGNIQLPLSRP